jgi:hypothetical protein
VLFYPYPEGGLVALSHGFLTYLTPWVSLKMMAKVLVGRFVYVTDMIVSSNQKTFNKG